jgi:hypothetical protein
MRPHDAEYILPLRRRDRAGEEDFLHYLRWLGEQIDVTIVDGSDPALFAGLHRRLPDGVRHLPPRHPGSNGKACGVMTGFDEARFERIIVADDDVRYDEAALAQMLDRLDGADFVRPQNVYTSHPWYVRVDTARMLVGRAFGGDFGGTVGVRRSRIRAAGGYRTDVLFENLELERVIRCGGGRIDVARDVFVSRVPPTMQHFARQRVRQAYDDFAQPARLSLELALAPLLALLLARRAWSQLGAVLLAGVTIAEIGRRAAGGAAVFPRSAALWTPLWLIERGIAVWFAVAARMRGGITYADHRIRDAATPASQLRRRYASGRNAHAR